MKTQEIIQNIQKTAFQYFQDFSNFKDEPGYGLTVDHTGDLNLATIAATGFALSSYPIGVQHGYIRREEALLKVKKTLLTLRDRVPHYHGFFAHFLDIHTAQRHKKCEYSTIDSALAFNGVITVSAYFNDPEITKIADDILRRVDWSILFHKFKGITRLYMAYNPDADGDYVNGRPGYIHHWSMLAEQLMMYVMIAATYPKDLALEIYHSFERKKASYRDISYYITPGNALFVYQYPLCWLNLKGVYDDQGISWFENTTQAIKGHYALCRDIVKDYPTFGQDYFGLTASYGLKGYQVCEALPNVNGKLHTDGTVSPNAMIGSLPFTPELSLKAIEKLYQEPGLWHEKYGFRNGFNNVPKRWITERFLSIDKGLELLMANAYLTQDVYKAYHAHPLVAKGMQVLQWKKK